MKPMNQVLLDAFHYRYACKQFDPKKAVLEEDFETILAAGRLSPSSFGLEPWHIIVLQDQIIKDKLASIAWGARNSLAGASHFVMLLARKKADTLYSSEYVTHMMKDVQHLPEDRAALRREAYRNFQENDLRLLESDRAIFDWACKQTYIVLANMLTAAALLGVDSCPIEGFDQQAVDALLSSEGVIDPEHFGISVMAGFGYRMEEPRQKTRRQLTDVVSWK